MSHGDQSISGSPTQTLSYSRGGSSSDMFPVSTQPAPPDLPFSYFPPTSLLSFCPNSVAVRSGSYKKKSPLTIATSTTISNPPYHYATLHHTTSTLLYNIHKNAQHRLSPYAPPLPDPSYIPPPPRQQKKKERATNTNTNKTSDV